MELIGKAIKEKRKEKGMTQAQLADKVGACYVSICNLEKGRNVNSRILKNVCNELDLKLLVVNKE